MTANQGPSVVLDPNERHVLFDAASYFFSLGCDERVPRYFDPGEQHFESTLKKDADIGNVDLQFAGLRLCSWERLNISEQDDVRKIVQLLLNRWRSSGPNLTMEHPTALFIAQAADAGLLKDEDIQEMSRAVEGWLSASQPRFQMENMQLYELCNNRTVLALGLIAQRHVLPPSTLKTLRGAYARFWWLQYMDEVSIGLATQLGPITNSRRFANEVAIELKSLGADAEMRHATAAIARERLVMAPPNIQSEVRGLVLELMRRSTDYDQAVALMRIITPKRPVWLRELIGS
jgi:hypothetical protein